MIVRVKKWTWYAFFVISIQLLVFYLITRKHANQKSREKSFINNSSISNRPSFVKHLITKKHSNEISQKKSFVNHSSIINRPSFVKHLLLQMFKLEFVNKTNIYQVSKTTILQAKKNERNNVYKPIDITLGMKEKHSYKLGNHIAGSDAINILIITRSRSGSTITGDMLSRYPGTFYSYEPLYFGIKTFGWDDWNDSGHKIWKLKQIFKCDPGIEFLEYAKSWPSLFYGNFRFKNACFQTSHHIFKHHDFIKLFAKLNSRELKKAQECFTPKIYHSVCSLFPIRLIKTIRIPFEAAETMLLDPEIGHTLKIIFLFRDPRARFKSMKSLNWCAEKQSINMCNVNSLCRDSTYDATAATTLKQKYPGESVFQNSQTFV